MNEYCIKEKNAGSTSQNKGVPSSLQKILQENWVYDVHLCQKGCCQKDWKAVMPYIIDEWYNQRRVQIEKCNNNQDAFI